MQQIEEKKFLANLRDDGIIHVNFSKGITIDLKCQEKMANAFLLLTEVNRPFIYTSDGNIAITREAQRNALEMDKYLPISASAVVVKNTAQKLLADFYYFFRPPRHPYQVHTSFQQGIDWLKEFRPSKEVITKEKH